MGLCYWQSQNGRNLCPTSNCQRWNQLALKKPQSSNRESSPPEPNQGRFDPPIARPDRENFRARSVQMRAGVRRSAWSTILWETIPSDSVYPTIRITESAEEKTLRYFPCDCPAIVRGMLRTLGRPFLRTPKRSLVLVYEVGILLWKSESAGYCSPCSSISNHSARSLWHRTGSATESNGEASIESFNPQNKNLPI